MNLGPMPERGAKRLVADLKQFPPRAEVKAWRRDLDRKSQSPSHLSLP
jgi:hypothetical protein